MATDLRAKRAEALAVASVKKYGADSAISGKVDRVVPYYPFGSLKLNYALGTGGAPGNALIEVFGPPSIGKTTVFGFSILRSVQAMGGITAMIATEPDVEDDWMERHGINLDHHVTFRPDTGEEAFELLRDLVYDKAVDYVLWDSLGGTSSAKEQNSEKPQAFGNSSLNSWGIRNIATKCWKNNVGVCFINQIRDKPNQKNLPIVTAPGGHAVEHFMKIIIQVKPGKDKFYADVDGEKLVVGQELISVMTKNKAAEGLNKTAKFNFMHIETDEYGLGIDRVADVLAAATTVGVVTGGTWLNHPSFPNGKINGKPATTDWLREQPEVVDVLEKEVLKVMKDREAEKAKKAKDRRLAQRSAKKA